MTPVMFVSQLIGPAQIFCRAFLSGRDRADPRSEADTLIACAIRALRPPERINNKRRSGAHEQPKPIPNSHPLPSVSTPMSAGRAL